MEVSRIGPCEDDGKRPNLNVKIDKRMVVVVNWKESESDVFAGHWIRYTLSAENYSYFCSRELGRSSGHAHAHRHRHALRLQ